MNIIFLQKENKYLHSISCTLLDLEEGIKLDDTSFWLIADEVRSVSSYRAFAFLNSFTSSSDWKINVVFLICQTLILTLKIGKCYDTMWTPNMKLLSS